MALLYDLREMMYKGKPVWKRVIENIVNLSDQIDSLGGTGSSNNETITALTDRIVALEGKVEALEEGSE